MKPLQYGMAFALGCIGLWTIYSAVDALFGQHWSLLLAGVVSTVVSAAWVVVIGEDQS